MRLCRRVSYAPGKGDKLARAQLEDPLQLGVINRGSKDAHEPFRCGKQVDVLADEPDGDRRLEPTVLGRESPIRSP
jgi:hypothetical protein